jgi:uncharacterized protein (UPF0332 family)
MKSETSQYFKEADRRLQKADEFLELEYYEDAGREAYLSGMNAARGLLFEDGFKINKKHKTLYSGLPTALHRRGIHDTGLSSFLPTIGELKRIADYLTGDDRITEEMAREAVEKAKNFVSTIKKIAATPAATPHNGKHKKPKATPR